MYMDTPGVSAYIAVGSNIEPEINVPAALERLCEKAPVRAVSTFYRTLALDRPGHPDFLNGVCQIIWHGSPHSLKFNVLRSIERDLGRIREQDSYAPRTIDLDLVLLGSWIMNEPGLVLPDPDICKRPFIAVPLLELEPGLMLPGTGKRLVELVAAMDKKDLTPEIAFTNALKARLLL